MNTKIRLAFCALAVAAAAWNVVCAQEPAGSLTGHVLVLDNERTLEGDIERQGDYYLVRRSVGELWIDSGSVLRLCQDREEAYTYLRTRANLRDPDERLRLAQWCHLHGLRSQAVEEVTAAVELRPQHAASRRWLAHLQKAVLIASPASNRSPVEEPEGNSSPPAVSTESLSLFIRRVQPILMNACASCHATGRGGAFKLARIYENHWTSRRPTQQNLLAVLEQVNKQVPQASTILIKAVSVHGDMSHAALKDRDCAAYRSLEEWIRITLEDNPQLVVGAPATTTSGVVPERANAGEPPADVATSQPSHAVAKEIGKPSSTAPPPEPADPYDPLHFNRQMHPTAKDTGAKK